MNPRDLHIEQYNYDLPEDRISSHPTGQRDASRLLHFKGSMISDYMFSDLPELLSEGDHLILNNTMVIPARLFFRKPTGALIEIFCLEPISSKGDFQSAMASTGSVDYECMVGGAAKWKEGWVYIQTDTFELKAEMLGRKGEFFQIRFTWTPVEKSFSEILDVCGELPLPPYFNRRTEPDDLVRYQTVYSEHKGSVAAPTAGLHFTPQIFEKLKAKGVKVSYITLHVGAGTFKPVTSEKVADHEMHREYFSIPQEVLAELSADSRARIVAVGTTTMRALESAYWLGVKQTLVDNDFHLGQWEAYDMSSDITRSESFRVLHDRIGGKGASSFIASTSIMIGPGYDFKVVKGLITNFHLPKSTLLLLISALIGDHWKEVYDHALANKYRFLSYGDSSLLWNVK
jgi:S-adenosylmethionine:tRNA ribosyltransferase-isomerase